MGCAVVFVYGRGVGLVGFATAGSHAGHPGMVSPRFFSSPFLFAAPTSWRGFAPVSPIEAGAH